jgi:hypothetical protein
MNNFDLIKFLAEGKLTANSKALNEDKLPTIKISKDIYYFDKLDRLDTKDNVDEKYHDKANLVFKKGQTVKDDTKYEDSDYKMITSSTSLEKGIDYLAEGKEKSSKMKMSELKKKIRQEILAELTLSEDSEVDVNISDPDPEYDPLDEATKDKDGKVPSKDANTDIDIEDEVDIDVEEKPKAGGDGDFLDQLEDLKDEADAIGDNKLERQVDNTITYFTRQHIAKDTNESLELEEDFGPAVQSTDPKAREIEKKIQDNPELQKQIAQIMAQAQKGGDTSKLLGMMTGLFEADELEEADDMALAAERDDAAHIAALEKDMKDDKRSSMNESLEILKMKKLAGLLTEGEYSKALLRETDWALLRKYVDELSKQVVRPDLYKSNFNVWEMALFYEYDEAVNKGFIKADEISKEEFNNLHNKLNDNYDFNYFVRNWNVLDDEETRHEEDMNKDLEYFKTSYNVDDETADIMKKVVDKFLNI